MYWGSKNLAFWLYDGISTYNLRTKIFLDIGFAQENRESLSIYLSIYLSIHLSIYLYGERERERKRKKEKESERARERETERQRKRKRESKTSEILWNYYKVKKKNV